MTELTEKQARFCEEYLLDLNATQAAIRAGYSPDTAYSIGHEILKKPEVADFLAQLQKERSQKTKIDAQWLLDRLAAEAQADVNDIYDEDGRILPISEWPMIFRQGLIAGIEVEEQYDYETSEDGKRGKKRIASGRVTKFKLDSRVKRLELIGRHIGVQAFRDTMQHTGTIGVAAVDTRNLTDEQLQVLASLAPPKPE